MRILYLDLDTLRPDHLGCYGYHRNTSPNIDRICQEGVRFDGCYVSDAPCLPSRAAQHSGRFGIHTGVVGHGGTAADMRIEGPERGFAVNPGYLHWAMVLQRLGFYTAMVSPFGQRHAAWWYYNGYREIHNTGRNGGEVADEVTPSILEWLDRRGKDDNWLLHVNYWDAHTPYRTPEEYGEPFADDPPPAWHTEEIRQRNWESFGPHSCQEATGWNDQSKWPRQPGAISSQAEYKRWIDGYDTGIHYMDSHIGRVFNKMADLGILDDTVILISADHGENQGELNVYGDHQTADHITCRVPLIIRWPGLPGERVDTGLHQQVDMQATVIDLLGGKIPARWDGQSFAEAMRRGESSSRPYIVTSQMAWACQRGLREGPYMLLRTWHDGFKDLRPYMLFDVENDPHELNDLAESHPDVLNRLVRRLDEWHEAMMASSDSTVDPLWTVMAEGGPLHTRTNLASYCERLRATGRTHHAERLERTHAQRNWK